MGKHRDAITRARCLQMVSDGASVKKAAKKFKLKYHTVYSWVRKEKKGANVNRKKGSGRKNALSQRLERRIVRWIELGDCDTATDVQRQMEKLKMKTVHLTTICRILRRHGLVLRRKKKKPALTKKHMKTRLQFSRDHLHWTVDDWSKVLFSDETKVNVQGSDGIRYVWTHPKSKDSWRRNIPTKAHGGGSVMVWGCFGIHGPGYACKINGGLNGELYQEVLGDEMLNSVDCCVEDSEDWIFLQDNAPCHKSKTTMKWFNKNKIQLIEFPPNSPDLNPIENLWFIVKMRIYRKGKYTSTEQVWEAFEKEWEKVEPELCEKLVNSMPQRMEMCVSSKGAPTRW